MTNRVSPCFFEMVASLMASLDKAVSWLKREPMFLRAEDDNGTMLLQRRLVLSRKACSVRVSPCFSATD